jgi:crotonobetainyl-CoA:carnitine CoA-transferase CaiB-like acyl-CoA transferase
MTAQAGGDPVPGALADLRVVELSSERGAFAGKLFADMGAEVITVEPPGGDPMRTYGPFLDDEPGPERSLYWWHYNTSKLGVTLDLESEQGRQLFRRLAASADLLIECEPPGRLAKLGLDYPDLIELREDLIMISITPFGRSGPRNDEHATDLTLLAGGGPVWSCGYDDHSLPPVRGGGNQGYHTACHYAVMSALVAVFVRDETGFGQHIDVNMHAAANVTTEAGSYDWLVARSTVQRQTGRHAAPAMTLETQIVCADGRYVNTGVPPRSPREFGILYDWIAELGLIEEFPEAFLLRMGERLERIDLSKLGEDEELQVIYGAGREGQNFIASRLSAYDYFIGAQKRGLPVGVIYAPEEVMEDPHFVARGFAVEVEHEDLGRSFTYPGAPYRFERSPWRIRHRAPYLGEHNERVLGALAFSTADRRTRS